MSLSLVLGMSPHLARTSVIKVATHLNSGVGTKLRLRLLLEDLISWHQNVTCYFLICAALVTFFNHLSNPDADKKLQLFYLLVSMRPNFFNLHLYVGVMCKSLPKRSKS